MNENNLSVVHKTTRYMRRQYLGLGMLRIDHFWKAIQMSWLRRLTFSKSTWVELHRAETRPYSFNPMSSTWSELKMARTKMDNLAWREIYGALLTCRRNMIKANPSEFHTLPVNGEPYTTKNNIAMQQEWCEKYTVRDILNRDGDFKKPEDYPRSRRPVCTVIVSALGDFINSYQYTCGKMHEGCIRDIGT